MVFSFEPEIDLSIVIVNYDVRDLLKRCLKSIFDFQKDLLFEVLVVDNGSEDQSRRNFLRSGSSKTTGILAFQPDATRG
jgi:glycosyltransferase involved in cell wall biosynthesis